MIHHFNLRWVSGHAFDLRLIIKLRSISARTLKGEFINCKHTDLFFILMTFSTENTKQDLTTRSTLRLLMAYHRCVLGHIDGLVQDCCNSSALTVELLQSSTKPSIWRCKRHFQKHFVVFKLFHSVFILIVRRAGLLWSQQDFEWRWSVPLFKCLTVLEFSFILFDLCLLITFFNFVMNYVPIVTFWIFTYHKIWILSIMFCFIWSYWIIYFLACLEVSWRVVS